MTSLVAQITGYAPPLTPMQADVIRARAQKRDRKGNIEHAGAQHPDARVARLEAFVSRQPGYEARVNEQALRFVFMRAGAWGLLMRGPTMALICRPNPEAADRGDGG